MKRESFLVISGPNLNLPGRRETSANAKESLEDIHAGLRDRAAGLGVRVECVQFNGEGEIIDTLQAAHGTFDGIIVNAGALACYSYALRSAIESASLPCIEVFISNVHKREDFQHNSVIAPVCEGVIGGFGKMSYILALEALVNLA